jgi:hypothetical protein
MPVTDIVILSIIVFAFLVFAVALAWGDHQTRQIARASRERAPAAAEVASITPKPGLERVAGAKSESGKASLRA